MKAKKGPKILFSHMLKTAGTSFTKKLAQYYGRSFHIIQGGSYLSEDALDREMLEKETQRIGPHLRVVSGHNLRPWRFMPNLENFSNYQWVTFLRNPASRFVSHYFYDFMRTDGFRYPKYDAMRDRSIEDWNSIENVSDYQTRFIAGVADVNKAKQILASQFKWVGLTELFPLSLVSFSQTFSLHGLDLTNVKSNTRKKNTLLPKIEAKDWDYIYHCNKLDNELYDFVLKNVWPKYTAHPIICDKRPKGIVCRKWNELSFIAQRIKVNQQTDLTINNSRRFLRRWFG